MFRLRKGIATIGGIMVLLGLVTAVADLSGAESPEEFYRGKNPTWIVAATPGSGTDLKARTIAPFLAREIGAQAQVPVEILGRPTPGAAPARYVPSVERIRVELGLVPTVGRREAICRTMDWHRFAEAP